MGVDAEDLDGDGLPELFVTNFENEYNTLYRNLDGRNFQDVSASAGIVKDSMPYVGWGCSLADFDNDGLPDMLVVNGHVDDNLAELGRPDPSGEPAHGLAEPRPADGSGWWRDPGPFFVGGHVARGAAFGDLDNDGDVDVVDQPDGRPARRCSSTSRTGRWLRLDLVGTQSNRPAIGAVEVHAGGRVLHRQVKGGGSYISANDHACSSASARPTRSTGSRSAGHPGRDRPWRASSWAATTGSSSRRMVLTGREQADEGREAAGRGACGDARVCRRAGRRGVVGLPPAPGAGFGHPAGRGGPVR